MPIKGVAVPCLKLGDLYPTSCETEGIYVDDIQSRLSKMPHHHKFVKHHHFEIYMIQGKAWYHGDFRCCKLQNTSIVFVNPGEFHAWNPHETLEGIVLMFQADLCAPEQENPNLSLVDHPYWFALTSPPNLSLCDQRKDIFWNLGMTLLKEFQHPKSHAREMLRAYLEMFLTMLDHVYLEKNCAGQEFTQRSLNNVKRFRRLMETSFRNPPTVEEYARCLGLSVSELSHSLKEVTQSTPASLIRDRILLEAKRLLIHSTMTAQEIAYFLGFKDASYFNKFFCKGMGLTPRLFRETQANQPPFSTSEE